MRVSDIVIPPAPGAVVEACVACCQPAFVDRVGSPDPFGVRLPLICVPCGLENPGTRGQVVRMCTTVNRMAAVLPPAQAGSAFRQRRYRLPVPRAVAAAVERVDGYLDLPGFLLLDLAGEVAADCEAVRVVVVGVAD